MTSRLKWVLALLALAALSLGAWRAVTAYQAKNQSATAQSSPANKVEKIDQIELAPTDVFSAKVLEISEGLGLSGALKAVNSAVVKARVAGELQGLTVREGDFVKAGQIVARIDSGEYQSRARQSRELAASSKAQVEVAERQYANNKALVDQGFISKTALDTSLGNLNAAQATYKAALAATEVAVKSLDDTVLKAPISGQVAQRMSQPGERVGIDARIVEIVDLSRLELEASLAAGDAMRVRIGQVAQLTVEGSKTPVAASVTRINPSAQAGSRNVLVYLTLDNAPSSSTDLPLRQGVFAQGSLGTAKTPLLAVPVSAIRTDKPTPYVQLVANGKVLHQSVQLGARGTSGLQSVVAVTGLANDAVVINGNVGALREGASVKFTQLNLGSASAPASASKPPAP